MKYSFGMILEVLMLFLVANVALAKPRGPISVTSSVTGVIQADQWVNVEFSIRASRNVDHVRTSIRGIKGVQVGGSSDENFGALKPKTTVKHRAMEKISGGKSGFIVVDVTWVSNGAESSMSVPFRVESEASKKIRAKKKPVVRESDGLVYEVSPAEKR